MEKMNKLEKIMIFGGIVSLLTGMSIIGTTEKYSNTRFGYGVCLSFGGMILGGLGYALRIKREDYKNE